MQGSSRQAFAQASAALHQAVGSSGSATTIADELIAVAGVCDEHAPLRRALADPSRSSDTKEGLAKQVFGSRISLSTMAVVDAVAKGRWAKDRDVDDALEQLAFDAQLMAAQQAGHLGDVQDELFRFERLVASNGDLAEGLTNPVAPLAARQSLAESLLAGKVTWETLWLVRAVIARLRGRHFGHVADVVLNLAAARREELTAVVTVATELSPAQRERLGNALNTMYGKPVFITVVLDPSVMGGVHIRVGDEVLDGTIARRLDNVRSELT